MTGPAAAAVAQWWPARENPDVVASEIVGPLARADLVAFQFDAKALRDRERAGIVPIDDLLAVRVILACRRAALTTPALVARLGLSLSAVRRAVRDGYDVGALHADGRAHRTHSNWRPAARRQVAVELKRSDWRRGSHQAAAYQAWANASWLILGQRPPRTAIDGLRGTGLGLGYLGEDERLNVVLRPVYRRRISGDMSIWVGEQAVALSRGSRAEASRRGFSRPANPLVLQGC